MPETINPLRYPGAKRSLVSYIDTLLEANHLQGCTFYEPYAGSAAVGLELLQHGHIFCYMRFGNVYLGTLMPYAIGLSRQLSPLKHGISKVNFGI